jgi:hypothetical protein
MKRILTLGLLSVLLLGACSKSTTDQILKLDGYKDSNNPFDNLAYCYSKAKEIAGDNVALIGLEGKQKSGLPSKDYNLRWNWYFIKGHTVLKFDSESKTAEVGVTDEVPYGVEYIYATDSRWNSILSPKVLWDKCIEKYNAPLVRVFMSNPLLTTPTNIRFVFNKNLNAVEDNGSSFMYDANTGNEVN